MARDTCFLPRCAQCTFLFSWLDPHHVTGGKEQVSLFQDLGGQRGNGCSYLCPAGPCPAFSWLLPGHLVHRWSDCKSRHRTQPRSNRPELALTVEGRVLEGSRAPLQRTPSEYSQHRGRQGQRRRGRCGRSWAGASHEPSSVKSCRCLLLLFKVVFADFRLLQLRGSSSASLRSETHVFAPGPFHLVSLSLGMPLDSMWPLRAGSCASTLRPASCLDLWCLSVSVSLCAGD